MMSDNLSNFANIEFITAASPEELKNILNQIKIPYQVIAIYAQNGNHVAWINPSQKLLKKVKEKKTK